MAPSKELYISTDPELTATLQAEIKVIGDNRKALEQQLAAAKGPEHKSFRESLKRQINRLTEQERAVRLRMPVMLMVEDAAVEDLINAVRALGGQYASTCARFNEAAQRDLAHAIEWYAGDVYAAQLVDRTVDRWVRALEGTVSETGGSLSVLVEKIRELRADLEREIIHNNLFNSTSAMDNALRLAAHKATAKLYSDMEYRVFGMAERYLTRFQQAGYTAPTAG